MDISYYCKNSLLEFGLIVEQFGYNAEQRFEKQKEWEDLNNLK